jgi:predicted DNA-binding protein
MQTTQNQTLVRKQFFISEKQTKKLEQIAKRENKSAAEIVRLAIDAYNPDALDDMEESELMELVSLRLKETIADTRKTRKRLNKTLKEFGVEAV